MSSTRRTSVLARMRLPLGTGAEKRTLFALVVLVGVGEPVDHVLGDLAPVAGADPLADEALSSSIPFTVMVTGGVLVVGEAATRGYL